MFFRLPKTLKEAEEIQREIALQVVKADSFKKICFVGGVDIHYTTETVKLGWAVLNFENKKIEDTKTKTFKRSLNWSYIPGYFCFYEGYYVVEFIKELKQKPDILLLDGHGIAHPRKAGLASYVGVVCDIPTIGCAKNILYGSYNRDKLERFRGSYVEIKNEFNETIGFALRTKDNVKEIFVSVGHKVSLNTAKEIVLTLSKYRIPEPLRIAHQLAKNKK